MTAEYIRRTYGVPAKRGVRVRVDGHAGVVTSCGHYIRVRFDGERRPRPCHPTWQVEYLDSTTPTRAIGAEKE